MAVFGVGKRDVYLSVAERYEEYIRLGVLREGEKLPSVRTVAGEIGVNPNTVQKAYSLLEEKGLIISMPKKGAFVVYKNDLFKSSDRVQQAMASILKLKQDGISEKEILSIVKEVYGND